MLQSMIAAAVASFAFSAQVTNPWFPLRPGDRYIYAGVKDGKRLEERTTDWYSQDVRGNVWYFGEDMAELDEHGKVTSTEGTWLAGRDGVRAGIYMPADPRVGQRAVLTKEWTLLEPGGLDHKNYVRGVGTILEETVKGGVERNVLVSLTHG